ncbi:MAG: HAMP domain-containing sensor histidine kinase, partial [Pseudomonadota bacterium]|nr:HAMP domain-containing sensor histidine kinase [Pseudomonadota bacterium]
MDRGDILSGNAFKAVLQGAVVFLVVLFVMAFFSLRLIDRTLTAEIQSRVLEMAAAMVELSDTDETIDLAERVGVITRGAAGQTLAYALFDKDGTHIAGNTIARPELGDWIHVPLTLDLPSGSVAQETEHMFLLHAVPAADRTLVVGRSTEFIASAKHTAIRGFALTGFVVVLAMLGIGYVLSQRSQSALEHIEAALDEVSQGAIAARINVGTGNGQIDRIAHRINAHLDQLDALFRQTQRTAVSVAHDLRRPLARATLQMERALAQVEAGRDARGDIEKSLADLAQLQSVIASILRIARIESGELGAMRPFDLRAVLDELAETFAPVAEDGAQQLIYAPSATPLMVQGDPEMLAQLVVNLVQNAIT